MSHFRANVYTSCTIIHSRESLQSLFRSPLAAFCPRSRLVPRDPAPVVPARMLMFSSESGFPRAAVWKRTGTRRTDVGPLEFSCNLHACSGARKSNCVLGLLHASLDTTGGRASLASCVRPLGDGNQCRQDIAELPDAWLTKREVDPVI
jgi:hypothetical protein